MESKYERYNMNMRAEIKRQIEDIWEQQEKMYKSGDLTLQPYYEGVLDGLKQALEVIEENYEMEEDEE